jgi:thymidine phosphorylase
MISSILSKKLAEGLDGLVLDIKFGSGAFTETRSGAVKLARQMSAVATGAGVACNALVTDMDAPLARSAGNALEIREAAGFLLGDDTHPRLREVTLRLTGELLYLGGLATSADAGMTTALGCLESGLAAEKFEAMIAAQGGPGNFLEHMDRHLPRSAVARPVISEQEGFVTAIDTRAVGEIVVVLGGGRQTINQRIDHGVGISELRSPGDWLDKGAALGVIHAADEERWQVAALALHDAYRLGPDRPQLNPVVHDCVEGARSNES